MNFFKRIAYYMGGFSVGIIVVLFFLSGKESSCSYFPNARVLKEIRFKQQEIAPEALQFFNTHQIDTLAIGKLLRQGKVNFSKSETSTKKPCRTYFITGDHQGKKLRLQVEECKETDSIATISKAEFDTP